MTIEQLREEAVRALIPSEEAVNQKTREILESRKQSVSDQLANIQAERNQAEEEFNRTVEEINSRETNLQEESQSLTETSNALLAEETEVQG
jgi:predicted kinase